MKKPHKHAALIEEWTKDTSRIIECKILSNKWVVVKDPYWRTSVEYRFADTVKPEKN